MKIFWLLPFAFFVQPAVSQTVNSMAMRLVPISAVAFYMGSERDGEDADENPVHHAVITKPFLMAATEVTNAQYEASDPAYKALRGKAGFSTAAEPGHCRYPNTR